MRKGRAGVKLPILLAAVTFNRATSSWRLLSGEVCAACLGISGAIASYGFASVCPVTVPGRVGPRLPVHTLGCAVHRAAQLLAFEASFLNCDCVAVAVSQPLHTDHGPAALRCAAVRCAALRSCCCPIGDSFGIALAAFGLLLPAAVQSVGRLNAAHYQHVCCALCAEAACDHKANRIAMRLRQPAALARTV